MLYTQHCVPFQSLLNHNEDNARCPMKPIESVKSKKNWYLQNSLNCKVKTDYSKNKPNSSFDNSLVWTLKKSLDPLQAKVRLHDHWGRLVDTIIICKYVIQLAHSIMCHFVIVIYFSHVSWRKSEFLNSFL